MTESGPGFWGRLRSSFFTGLLISAPLGLTLYIAWSFIQFVDSKVKPLIPPRYLPDTYLPYELPGVGLVVAVVTLIMIGGLAKGLFGRFFIGIYERILNRIPVVRGIYSAIKQILETVFASKADAFRQVVLLEYPRKGLWALGFVTGSTKGEAQARTASEVINVFLPTTPNPTSGFLLFVPRTDLIFLTMSVEDGIKMVVSGGIVTPPYTAV